MEHTISPELFEIYSNNNSTETPPLQGTNEFDPHIEIKKSGQEFETADILQLLWIHFPEFAKGIILYYLGNGEHTPEIESFYTNIDDPQEHAPQYHQWGILTHSKKFEEFFRTKVPNYLLTWHQEHILTDLQNETIDGRSKHDLMQISIPLHDFGKFAVRRTWHQPDGTFHSFNRHEASSGAIIRGELFQKWLQEKLGLTPHQIEYIAQCAELHYELGIVRNLSKQFDGGYGFPFLKTDLCTQEVQTLAQKYQGTGMAREVGLLFLADSLAKTDIILPANTDSELQSFSKDQIKQQIKRAGVNPHLLETIRYRPVNVALAKKYFEELR